MAKIKVELESHREEIIEAMEDQLKTALDAIGADAASTAANKAPVDTGNLKNSIGHAVDGKTVYIGTNVEYAPYQELGTSTGIPAKHFLKHGVEAHSSQYADIIKNALES